MLFLQVSKKKKKKDKNIGLFPESNRGHLYPKQVFYH